MSGKDRRMELGRKLRQILGNNNVYFQPPNNSKIEYPCIIYSKEKPSQVRADNKVYLMNQKYEILTIDWDPDSAIAEDVLNAFDSCTINRNFVKDNLHQTSLTLYY